MAALLAVALVAPSLGAGWFLDDLWHRAGATKASELAAYLGETGDFAGPMRMYAFWDGDRARTERLIDRGIIPWWSDPAVRIAFWRPFSALTHALDYALWPERAFLMHAQSTLWLGLLVVAAGLSYRRVVGATWVAGLAALLFALSDSQALPAAWLANRHALVAGCLGLASFYAHLSGRATASRACAIAAWIAFALCLLASEAGVVVAAYLGAYAIVLERASWRARLATLVPYAVIVAVWRLAYTGLGYGVVGSTLYVDPAGDPLRFLRTLCERAPALAVSLLGFPVADASLLLSPRASLLLAGGSSAVLLALTWLTRPLWRGCRTCGFFALAAGLTLVPLSAAMPGARNLGLAAFGAAGLLAHCAAHAGTATAPVVRRASVPAATAVLVLLLVLRLVLAPLGTFASAVSVSRLGPGVARMLDVDGAARGRLFRQLVIVNPPCSLGIFFLVPHRLLQGLPLPAHTRVLAPGAVALELERISGREIIVRPDGGYCVPPGAPRGDGSVPDVSLDNVLRRADGFLCGAPGGLQPADVVSLTGVTVRVPARLADGRAREARFEFDRPLEDPGTAWLRWNGAAYEAWTPPAIGERARLE